MNTNCIVTEITKRVFPSSRRKLRHKAFQTFYEYKKLKNYKLKKGKFMNEILTALEWRYATKIFDSSRKISAEDWQILLESLRLAPSSYGLQPWKFLIVQTADLREKLRTVSWNQSQVTDCSHYVVFTTKQKITEADIKHYVQKMAEVRGVSVDSLTGYQNAMLHDVVYGPRSQIVNWWTQRQAYIAMGFLMETAALLKIDACPLEGLEAESYDEILQLKNTDWRTVAACALGYRSPKDKLANLPKVRFDSKDVIEYL